MKSVWIQRFSLGFLSLGLFLVFAAVYTVGLPTTLFFGSDGKVRGRHLGEIDEKTLREKMEVLR